MREALRYTRDEFGERKRREYVELIQLALRAIVEHGEEAGTARPEVCPDAFTLPIASFARRAKAARHLLLYRARGDMAEIGAFLYDGMDLERHVPSARRTQRQ